MMKQPDVFDAIVERFSWDNAANVECVTAADAAKLLRAQHRKVRRMVKKYRTHMVPFDVPREDAEISTNQGHFKACGNIIAALDKMAGKGKFHRSTSTHL